MKKPLLILLFITGVLFAVRGQTMDTAAKAPQITFNDTIFDFGEIPFNIPARCEFEFTNTGDEPLILNTVNSSCGCVVPSYIKDPVLPGKTGWMKATFSASVLGTFNKYLTVFSNAKGSSQYVILYLKGTVVEKSALPKKE